MIENRFDPSQPHDVVAYLRMSSERQNPRSPDQQLQVIMETVRHLNYPWCIAKSYRDAGISGRLVRNRPEFALMRRELLTGVVKASLILVDSFDRLGRSNALPEVLREFERHNIFVVSADRQFANPCNSIGRFTQVLDQFRSTEENATKARMVLRGKADAARQKFWPGGPAPFGYVLDPQVPTAGAYKKIRSHLKIDPIQSGIVKLAFDLAIEKGWGQEKIAAYLNDHAEIPSELKPFSGATIGRMFDNTVYCGDLVWGVRGWDVVDDRRVSQAKSQDEIVHVSEFCEGIVSREKFQSLQVIRDARRKKFKDRDAKRKSKQGGGGLGQTLVYPLSGLVRCECGRAMVPTSSAAYTKKDGTSARYVAYACPARAGICSNRKRAPEDWLRTIVATTVIKRLVDPFRDQSDSFLSDLRSAIQSELNARKTDRTTFEGLAKEKLRLEKQRKGWVQSLGDDQIDSELRQQLQQQYRDAGARINEIERQESTYRAVLEQESSLISSEKLMANLSRLGEHLGAANPTRLNLELALHIDQITIYHDGRIEMRTCKLGGVLEAIHFLRDPELTQTISSSQPRRRSKLNLFDDKLANLPELIDFATNPDRFASIPDKWFWVDRFELPEYSCWGNANAGAVFQYWLSNGKPSVSLLAKQFQKSKPTLRRSLKIGQLNANYDVVIPPTESSRPNDGE